MPAIDLKKMPILFAILSLSLFAYHTCGFAHATEQSVQLTVPGCGA